MKFIAIASDSAQDLAAQVEHLKEDGWRPLSKSPAVEGRLYLTHLEKAPLPHAGDLANPETHRQGSPAGPS